MFQQPQIRALTTFTLQGDQKWAWAPALIARVSMGSFFAISGGNKLFDPTRAEALIKVMMEAGIPFPEFLSVFLASVEFFGGLFLIGGFLSTFCAIATVELHTIPKGLSALDWWSWFLYLPQVLYVMIFGWLMIVGPGRYSADHIIANKLGVDQDA